jgi:hypothetical protein
MSAEDPLWKSEEMQDGEMAIFCPAAIRKTEYHSDLQQLPVCRSDRRPGGCFFCSAERPPEALWKHGWPEA